MILLFYQRPAAAGMPLPYVCVDVGSLDPVGLEESNSSDDDAEECLTFFFFVSSSLFEPGEGKKIISNSRTTS